MMTIYLKQHNSIVRQADVKMFDELGYDDILWIDLIAPSKAEQRAVEGFMEVSLQTRQQIEEIESTSKYSETENATITNSNFFMPSKDGFSVEPVSFIVSEGILISQRNREMHTFTEAAKRLQMNWKGFPTGYHMLISILEVRIDYDADLVESIARQIASLSKDISTMDKVDHDVLHRINLLQESTMLIRENIFDRQRVLSGILRSERFPRDIYPKLSLMIKDVNSLISHADFDSERLDYLQEAAMGLINIEQNSIMRIFTVAMLLFMPATLLTGMWGMNFDRMPGLHSWWGFPFVLVLIAALVISMFVYFRRKKWL
jgi:magnesium transporter